MRTARRALADIIHPEGAAERAELRKVRQDLEEEARADVLSLFHRLWGKGHDGPRYYKSEWTRIQRYLHIMMSKAGWLPVPEADVSPKGDAVETDHPQT